MIETTQNQRVAKAWRRFSGSGTPDPVRVLLLLALVAVLSGDAFPIAPDVLVDIGDLPPGKTITIEFDTTIRNPFPALVDQVSNQGYVTGAGMAAVLTDDPDTAEASDATVTEITAAPDLVLSKGDGGGSHAPGDAILYTLSYFNIGDQDETNTVLTETVPANTTFDPGASTAGWVCVPDGNPGSTCALAIGNLPGGGGGGSAMFAVLIDDPVPPGTQLIANTASVSGAQTDPNPGNNSATEITVLSAKLPDINGDGSVTAADLLILMQEYHTDSARSDLNGDNWVDEEDLWILGNKWEAGGTQ